MINNHSKRLFAIINILTLCVNLLTPFSVIAPQQVYAAMDDDGGSGGVPKPYVPPPPPPPAPTYTCTGSVGSCISSGSVCEVPGSGTCPTMQKCCKAVTAPITCTGSVGSCISSSTTCAIPGTGTCGSYQKCCKQVTVATPVPPPAKRYTCNSSYQCVESATGGYMSLDSCTTNCKKPVDCNGTKVNEYACLDQFTCVQCQSTGLFSQTKTVYPNCKNGTTSLTCNQPRPVAPPTTTTSSNPVDPACRDYWCNGCNGFCGREGILAGKSCTTQQLERCNQKPCWELGTCTTLVADASVCKDSADCYDNFPNIRKTTTGEVQVLFPSTKPCPVMVVAGKCWVPVTTDYQEEFASLPDSYKLYADKAIEIAKIEAQKAAEEQARITEAARNAAIEAAETCDNIRCVDEYIADIPDISNDAQELATLQARLQVNIDTIERQIDDCLVSPDACSRAQANTNALVVDAEIKQELTSQIKIATVVGLALEDCIEMSSTEQQQCLLKYAQDRNLTGAELTTVQTNFSTIANSTILANRDNYINQFKSASQESIESLCRQKVLSSTDPDKFNVVRQCTGDAALSKVIGWLPVEIQQQIKSQRAAFLAAEQQRAAQLNALSSVALYGTHAADSQYVVSLCQYKQGHVCTEAELIDFALGELRQRDSNQYLSVKETATVIDLAQAISNNDRQTIVEDCIRRLGANPTANGGLCTDPSQYSLYATEKVLTDTYQPEYLTQLRAAIIRQQNQLSTISQSGFGALTIQEQLDLITKNQQYCEQVHSDATGVVTYDPVQNACKVEVNGQIITATSLGTDTEPKLNWLTNLLGTQCGSPRETYNVELNKCVIEDALGLYVGTVQTTASGRNTITCIEGYRPTFNLLTGNRCIKETDADTSVSVALLPFTDNFDASRGTNITSTVINLASTINAGILAGNQATCRDILAGNMSNYDPLMQQRCQSRYPDALKEGEFGELTTSVNQMALVDAAIRLKGAQAVTGHLNEDGYLDLASFSKTDQEAITSLAEGIVEHTVTNTGTGGMLSAEEYANINPSLLLAIDAPVNAYATDKMLINGEWQTVAGAFGEELRQTENNLVGKIYDNLQEYDDIQDIIAHSGDVVKDAIGAYVEWQLTNTAKALTLGGLTDELAYTLIREGDRKFAPQSVQHERDMLTGTGANSVTDVLTKSGIGLDLENTSWSQLSPTQQLVFTTAVENVREYNQVAVEDPWYRAGSELQSVGAAAIGITAAVLAAPSGGLSLAAQVPIDGIYTALTSSLINNHVYTPAERFSDDMAELAQSADTPQQKEYFENLARVSDYNIQTQATKDITTQMVMDVTMNTAGESIQAIFGKVSVTNKLMPDIKIQLADAVNKGDYVLPPGQTVDSLADTLFKNTNTNVLQQTFSEQNFAKNLILNANQIDPKLASIISSNTSISQLTSVNLKVGDTLKTPTGTVKLADGAEIKITKFDGTVETYTAIKQIDNGAITVPLASKVEVVTASNPLVVASNGTSIQKATLFDQARATITKSNEVTSTAITPSQVAQAPAPPVAPVVNAPAPAPIKPAVVDPAAGTAPQPPPTISISEVKVVQHVTPTNHTVNLIDPASVPDASKTYVDTVNARLTQVQESIGFPLYSKQVDSSAPSDQVNNIVRAATRGDESQFLVAAGGSGKTETSAIAAAERFHYTGRKQIMVVESTNTIDANAAQYSKIFDAEGINHYFLKGKIADLSPEEFAKLQNADVIVTTNKIGYEWLPDYGKGAAHPEFQAQFIHADLPGSNGFEFVVDEVATIWKPDMRLSISGDSVAYMSLDEGIRDTALLSNSLGWNIDPSGQVTTHANLGPLSFLSDAMTGQLQHGTNAVDQLFDAVIRTTTGDRVFTQNIRTTAYRNILLDLKAKNPSLAESIDKLLGEFIDDTAFNTVLARNDEALLTAFEQRLNGLRTMNISPRNPAVQLRDSFLEQAGVMETLQKLYSDVAANNYEPIRKLITQADGSVKEVWEVVPKERNVFEGKQLSEGMQKLIYNTEGTRIYNAISGQNLPLDVSVVTLAKNSQDITLLQVSAKSKSTLGLSLEADEVAQVWNGAVANAQVVGDIETARFLYGTLPDGTALTANGLPARPVNAINEIDSISGINGNLKTRNQLLADGETGVFAVNAADTNASNLEVRLQFQTRYADMNQIIRNRNDLHEIVEVTSMQNLPNGNRLVTANRQRVEMVEVDGQMKYRQVEERITNTVDTEGRLLSQAITPTRVGSVVDSPPVTLNQLDEIKLAWRQDGQMYLDYYEKGADIGVNPLSFKNESLRVVGDTQNTSSEWYQAVIRARGNEGKTAQVYTQFSPDAEFIIIGNQNRTLSLDEFRTIADGNGIRSIQARATQTRFQQLNEFLHAKTEQIYALMGENPNVKTQIDSIVKSTDRRMNVRIGANAADIEVELAAQARMVQETLDHIASLGPVKQKAHGTLGFGGNKELADVLNQLTARRSIPDALDLSKRFSAEELQHIKPYTQAENVMDMLDSMTAYTYVDKNNPLLSNVQNQILRGVTGPKTAFTQTIGQALENRLPAALQPVAREARIAVARDGALKGILQLPFIPVKTVVRDIASRLSWTPEKVATAIVDDHRVPMGINLQTGKFTFTQLVTDIVSNSPNRQLANALKNPSLDLATAVNQTNLPAPVKLALAPSLPESPLSVLPPSTSTPSRTRAVISAEQIDAALVEFEKHLSSPLEEQIVTTAQKYFAEGKSVESVKTNLIIDLRPVITNGLEDLYGDIWIGNDYDSLREGEAVTHIEAIADRIITLAQAPSAPTIAETTTQIEEESFFNDDWWNTPTDNTNTVPTADSEPVDQFEELVAEYLDNVPGISEEQSSKIADAIVPELSLEEILNESADLAVNTVPTLALVDEVIEVAEPVFDDLPEWLQQQIGNSATFQTLITEDVSDLQPTINQHSLQDLVGNDISELIADNATISRLDNGGYQITQESIIRNNIYNIAPLSSISKDDLNNFNSVYLVRLNDQMLVLWTGEKDFIPYMFEREDVLIGSMYATTFAGDKRLDTSIPSGKVDDAKTAIQFIKKYLEPSPHYLWRIADSKIYFHTPEKLNSFLSLNWFQLAFENAKLFRIRSEIRYAISQALNKLKTDSTFINAVKSLDDQTAQSMVIDASQNYLSNNDYPDEYAAMLNQLYSQYVNHFRRATANVSNFDLNLLDPNKDNLKERLSSFDAIPRDEWSTLFAILDNQTTVQTVPVSGIVGVLHETRDGEDSNWWNSLIRQENMHRYVGYTLQGQSLPDDGDGIDLHDLGGGLYGINGDGHHRTAVAKALGIPNIRAKVTSAIPPLNQTINIHPWSDTSVYRLAGQLQARLEAGLWSGVLEIKDDHIEITVTDYQGPWVFFKDMEAMRRNFEKFQGDKFVARQIEPTVYSEENIFTTETNPILTALPDPVDELMTPLVELVDEQLSDLDLDLGLLDDVAQAVIPGAGVAFPLVETVVDSLISLIPDSNNNSTITLTSERAAWHQQIHRDSNNFIVDPDSPEFGEFLSNGSQGRIYLNREKSIITKILKGNLEGEYLAVALRQIEVYQQAQGADGLLAKFIAVIKDDQGNIVGWQQEYIPNLQPLSSAIPPNDVDSLLTLDEFTQAIIDLRTLHNVTGHVMGDMVEFGWQNVNLQIDPITGHRRIVFIDYAGYNNEVTTPQVAQELEWDEIDFFIRKLIGISHSADYELLNAAAIKQVSDWYAQNFRQDHILTILDSIIANNADESRRTAALAQLIASTTTAESTAVQPTQPHAEEVVSKPTLIDHADVIGNKIVRSGLVLAGLDPVYSSSNYLFDQLQPYFKKGSSAQDVIRAFGRAVTIMVGEMGMRQISTLIPGSFFHTAAFISVIRNADAVIRLAVSYYRSGWLTSAGDWKWSQNITHTFQSFINQPVSFIYNRRHQIINRAEEIVRINPFAATNQDRLTFGISRIGLLLTVPHAGAFLIAADTYRLSDHYWRQAHKGQPLAAGIYARIRAINFRTIATQAQQIPNRTGKFWSALNLKGKGIIPGVAARALLTASFFVDPINSVTWPIVAAFSAYDIFVQRNSNRFSQMLWGIVNVNGKGFIPALAIRGFIIAGALLFNAPAGPMFDEAFKYVGIFDVSMFVIKDIVSTIFVKGNRTDPKTGRKLNIFERTDGLFGWINATPDWDIFSRTTRAQTLRFLIVSLTGVGAAWNGLRVASIIPIAIYRHFHPLPKAPAEESTQTKVEPHELDPTAYVDSPWYPAIQSIEDAPAINPLFMSLSSIQDRGRTSQSMAEPQQDDGRIRKRPDGILYDDSEGVKRPAESRQGYTQVIYQPVSREIAKDYRLNTKEKYIQINIRLVIHQATGYSELIQKVIVTEADYKKLDQSLTENPWNIYGLLVRLNANRPLFYIGKPDKDLNILPGSALHIIDLAANKDGSVNRSIDFSTPLEKINASITQELSRTGLTDYSEFYNQDIAAYLSQGKSRRNILNLIRTRIIEQLNAKELYAADPLVRKFIDQLVSNIYETGDQYYTSTVKAVEPQPVITSNQQVDQIETEKALTSEEDLILELIDLDLSEMANQELQNDLKTSQIHIPDNNNSGLTGVVLQIEKYISSILNIASEENLLDATTYQLVQDRLQHALKSPLTSNDYTEVTAACYTIESALGQKSASDFGNRLALTSLMDDLKDLLFEKQVWDSQVEYTIHEDESELIEPISEPQRIDLKSITGAVENVGTKYVNPDESYRMEDAVGIYQNPTQDFQYGAVLMAEIDGMGGHGGGDKVAQLIKERVADIYFTERSETNIPERLRNTIRQLQSEVVSQPWNKSGKSGAVVDISILVQEGNEQVVYIAHIGDTETWLIRNGKAQLLTKDHTQVQEIVNAGLITEREAARHPQRNVVTRAIGGQLDDDRGDITQVIRQVVQPGDVIISMSDGVIDPLIYNNELTKTMELAVEKLATPQQIAHEIVGTARFVAETISPKVDNISAVVLKIGDRLPSFNPVPTLISPSTGQHNTEPIVNTPIRRFMQSSPLAFGVVGAVIFPHLAIPFMVTGVLTSSATVIVPNIVRWIQNKSSEKLPPVASITTQSPQLTPVTDRSSTSLIHILQKYVKAYAANTASTGPRSLLNRLMNPNNEVFTISDGKTELLVWKTKSTGAVTIRMQMGQQPSEAMIQAILNHFGSSIRFTQETSTRFSQYFASLDYVHQNDIWVKPVIETVSKPTLTIFQKVADTYAYYWQTYTGKVQSGYTQAMNRSFIGRLWAIPVHAISTVIGLPSAMLNATLGAVFYDLTFGWFVESVVAPWWTRESGGFLSRQWATQLEYNLFHFNVAGINREKGRELTVFMTRTLFNMAILPNWISQIPLIEGLGFTPQQIWSAFRSTRAFTGGVGSLKRLGQIITTPNLKLVERISLGITAVASAPAFLVIEQNAGLLGNLNPAMWADMMLMKMIGEFSQGYALNNRESTRALRYLEAMETGITLGFAVSSLQAIKTIITPVEQLAPVLTQPATQPQVVNLTDTLDDPLAELETESIKDRLLIIPESTQPELLDILETPTQEETVSISLDLSEDVAVLVTNPIDTEHLVTEDQILSLVQPYLIDAHQIIGNYVYGNDVYLHQEVSSPLSELWQTAHKEGVALYVRSGFRSLDDQAIAYSQSPNAAMIPGGSQHHTGLAIDFSTPENSHAISVSSGFENTTAGQWLDEHAWEYGFIRPYTEGHNGIPPESWHYFYVGKELSGQWHEGLINGQDWFALQASLNEYRIVETNYLAEYNQRKTDLVFNDNGYLDEVDRQNMETALQLMAPFQKYMPDKVVVEGLSNNQVAGYALSSTGIQSNETDNGYILVDQINLDDTYRNGISHLEEKYSGIDPNVFTNETIPVASLIHEVVHGSNYKIENGGKVVNELFTNYVRIFFSRSISINGTTYTDVNLQEIYKETYPTNYVSTYFRSPDNWTSQRMISEDLSDAISLYLTAPEYFRTHNPYRYAYLDAIAHGVDPNTISFIDTDSNGLLTAEVIENPLMSLDVIEPKDGCSSCKAVNQQVEEIFNSIENNSVSIPQVVVDTTLVLSHDMDNDIVEQGSDARVTMAAADRAIKADLADDGQINQPATKNILQLAISSLAGFSLALAAGNNTPQTAQGQTAINKLKQQVTRWKNYYQTLLNSSTHTEKLSKLPNHLPDLSQTRMDKVVSALNSEEVVIEGIESLAGNIEETKNTHIEYAAPVSFINSTFSVAPMVRGSKNIVKVEDPQGDEIGYLHLHPSDMIFSIGDLFSTLARQDIISGTITPDGSVNLFVKVKKSTIDVGDTPFNFGLPQLLLALVKLYVKKTSTFPFIAFHKPTDIEEGLLIAEWVDQHQDEMGLVRYRGKLEGSTVRFSLDSSEQNISKEESIEKIKTRSPQLLSDNFNRSQRGLIEYFNTKIWSQKPWWSRVFKSSSKTLAQKQSEFETYFNQIGLFDEILHFSNTRIFADSTGKITLLSPAQLSGDDQDISSANRSYEIDAEIGNTRFVFAGINKLRSASMVGENAYQIHPDNDKAYVVPLDLSDMLRMAEQFGFTEAEWKTNTVFSVYADNIYTAEDFKKFFILYASVIFDTPEQALQFFHATYWQYKPLGYDNGNPQSANDPYISVRTWIKDVVDQYGIIPPTSPEYQYRDSVSAHLVSTAGNSNQRNSIDLQRKNTEISQQPHSISTLEFITISSIISNRIDQIQQKVSEKLPSHILQSKLNLIRQYESNAATDPLTGLSNRRAFNNAFKQILERVKRHHSTVSIISIELDNFGQVNKTLDYEAGDQALKILAQILQREFRTEDIKARMGGDEFTLLLEGISQEDVDKKAEQLRQAIEDGLKEYGVTASLGVVRIDRDLLTQASSAMNPDLLPHLFSELADSAVYTAKANGKNRIVTYGNDSVLVKPLNQLTDSDATAIHAALGKLLNGDVVINNGEANDTQTSETKATYAQQAYLIYQNRMNQLTQNFWYKVPGIKWIMEMLAISQILPDIEPFIALAEQESLIDPLTGLPNRAAFNTQHQAAMNRYLRTNKPVSYIYIDLDGFKEANDRWGHAVGDRVLQRVAHIIQSVIREYDHAARLGGDEFVIILDVDNPQAMVVAERIHQAIEAVSQEMVKEEFGLGVSASIGVATLPKHDLEIPTEKTAIKQFMDTYTSIIGDAILKAAEQAMKAVKAEGKNGIHNAEGVPIPNTELNPDPQFIRWSNDVGNYLQKISIIKNESSLGIWFQNLLNKKNSFSSEKYLIDNATASEVVNDMLAHGGLKTIEMNHSPANPLVFRNGNEADVYRHTFNGVDYVIKIPNNGLSSREYADNQLFGQQLMEEQGYPYFAPVGTVEVKRFVYVVQRYIDGELVEHFSSEELQNLYDNNIYLIDQKSNAIRNNGQVIIIDFGGVNILDPEMKTRTIKSIQELKQIETVQDTTILTKWLNNLSLD